MTDLIPTAVAGQIETSGSYSAVSYKWENNRRAMPRKNNIIDTRLPPIISPASRQMSLVGRLMQEVGSTAPRKMGLNPPPPLLENIGHPRP
jgi:hypothetical protein